MNIEDMAERLGIDMNRTAISLEVEEQAKADRAQILGRVYCLYAMATAKVEASRYVKFGISSDVPYRLRSVQTGCPLLIDRVMFIPCATRGRAQDAEKALHKHFEPRSSSGEWFRFDDGKMDEFSEGVKVVMDSLFGEFWIAKYWKLGKPRHTMTGHGELILAGDRVLPALLASESR